MNGQLQDCPLLKGYCQHAVFGPSIQQACPSTCGLCVCQDTPNWLDNRGYKCSAWAGYDCTKATSRYWYSAAAQNQLLVQCRLTCKRCTPPPDNSCQYARDGSCDEPQSCLVGTDCSDCGSCWAPTTTAAPTLSLAGAALLPTTTTLPAATWKVVSGNCTLDESMCASSPNYPAEYPANQGCQIDVGPNMGPITVVNFTTEAGFDVLTVNGRPYSGFGGPEGVVPTGFVLWNSDASGVAIGWKICSSTLSAASLLDDSCRYSNDGVCDSTPDCAEGTDCTDCGTCLLAGASDGASTSTTSTPGAPTAVDNSCAWSRNGVCDETGSAPLCRRGTDCSDCGACSFAGASDDTCASALDGWCDEPKNCYPGTDCTDCGNCAAPPASCTCQAVGKYPARCGDLASDGSAPWCYVRSSCDGSRWSLPSRYWVKCESTGPGGGKRAQAPAWVAPAGCACVKGHPLGATCADRNGHGKPWCYATGTCTGLKKTFAGTWVECVLPAAAARGVAVVIPAGQAATASPPPPMQSAPSPLLEDISVVRLPTGGYNVSVSTSPEVAEVQVDLRLAYWTDGAKATLYTATIPGHFRAGGFEASWDGTVPYLRQGNKVARAKFLVQGIYAVSVPAIYFPLGVVPRQVAGYYASTGGQPARLIFSLNGTATPALYAVSPGDGETSFTPISAIPPVSGGMIGPLQDLDLGAGGASDAVIDEIMMWGLQPEAPAITIGRFNVTASSPPIPFQLAIIRIQADRDPPRTPGTWEASREVPLDGRGKPLGKDVQPCRAHIDCGASSYCWDCAKCRNSTSADFCLNCRSGAFCGDLKFCDCDPGSQVCDSVDAYCPGDLYTKTMTQTTTSIVTQASTTTRGITNTTTDGSLVVNAAPTARRPGAAAAAAAVAGTLRALLA